MTHRVAFVGPLPPPVNGFSNICKLMRQRLVERTEVDTFDRGRHSNPAQWVAVQLLTILQCAGLYLRRRNTTLYLALSGGRGQAIDVMYLLLGRLFRTPIFIHHHSFAYVNSSSLLNEWFFSLVGNAIHIVLTPGMGAALGARYRLDPANIRVVSNAAFFEHSIAEELQRPDSRDSSDVKIGYLSNITFEKGFVEFFAIIDALQRQGTPFNATIAGPLADSAREHFNALLAAYPKIKYIGPLYGPAKDSFYRELDIFVFPTKYLNEAEPLVLYEAMSASVYVIACDRGGIREMLGSEGLAVPEASIVKSAAECISRLSADRDELMRAKAASRRHAQNLSTIAAAQLNDILNRIVAA